MRLARGRHWGDLCCGVTEESRPEASASPGLACGPGGKPRRAGAAAPPQARSMRMPPSPPTSLPQFTNTTSTTMKPHAPCYRCRCWLLASRWASAGATWRPCGSRWAGWHTRPSSPVSGCVRCSPLGASPATGSACGKAPKTAHSPISCCATSTAAHLWQATP